MPPFNNEHAMTCVVCLGVWLVLVWALHSWAYG